MGIFKSAGLVAGPLHITLASPLRAQGLVIRTGLKSVFRDLPAVYKKYMKLKGEYGIPHQKKPWEYISLSRNFSGDNSWDYYTGHAVDSHEHTPEVFVNFEAPAGTYAVFPIRKRNRFMLGMAMGKMKKYIYDDWLPSSGYEFSGYEFEYNNEEMARECPYFIDLYVGVKETEAKPEGKN